MWHNVITVASHFDSIGFAGDDQEQLAHFVKRALAEGDQLEVIGAEPGWGGRYVCWEVGNGVQMWVSVDEKGNVSSVDPHYAGRSRANITLERSYDYEQAPPAGGVFAWVAVGTEQETKAGFDLPAFARFYDMACDYDGNALVQVAAFCHGGQAYANEAEYLVDQTSEGEKLKFAVESFIPIGLFDESGEMPAATARFSGHVLEAEEVENPATGGKFWRVLVKTFGMTVDVVAHAEQLEGRPVVGGVLAGSFWLSALPAEGPRSGAGRFIDANAAPVAAPAPSNGEAKITITKMGE